MLPGDLMIALRGLNHEESRMLPIKAGGLFLRGTHVGWRDRWLLVGYRSDQEVPDPEVSGFKSLIEKIPVLILRMEADGVVRYANPEAFRMTGYTAGELVGRPFLVEAVHPEDQWKLDGLLRQVQEESGATAGFRFRTRDGAWRVAEIHLHQSEAGDSIEGIAFDVTEQTEVEEALFQSKTLYRTFMEQSPIGMLHLDAQGIVTFENHPFRQIVGEAVEDAWIGLNIFERTDIDERLHQLLHELFETGKAFHGEAVTYLARYGVVPHALVVHGSPIVNIEGSIVGGVVMVEDVTEKQQRETELSLRDRYGLAGATLREAAMLTADEETQFLQEAARIVGEATGADRIHLLLRSVVSDRFVSRVVWPVDEEITGLNLRTSAFTSLQEAAHEAHSLYLDRRTVDDAELVLLAVDEATSAIWAPFNENGETTGFVLLEKTGTPEDAVAYWDHSERYLIDQLVRVFETLWAWILVGNRYRRTVSTIDDGLFNYTIDADGNRRYLFATHQIETLVGYSPGYLLARGDRMLRWIEDLVHPADHMLIRAHDRKLEEEEESHVVYRVQHRDGSTRWLREHGTPYRDPAGHLIVSGILTDVTEQKVAEEVLLQAKHEAESSNRLKTAFIATMSHELRTPLGAINGFAEILSSELQELQSSGGTPLPEQIEEFVEAIHERSKKLLGLVNDLFELSNMEMGSVKVQRVPVPIHELLANITDHLADALEARQNELHLDLDPGRPVAVGDALRISQVLENLISNAVKFTEKGRITVRTRHISHEVVVEVEDTGVGMAEEYLEKLFTPFSQEDEWRNRRFEGTGLGLALVRRLLELLGGRIEVKTEKGVGSLFRVFLPAARQTPLRGKRSEVRTT